MPGPLEFKGAKSVGSERKLAFDEFVCLYELFSLFCLVEHAGEKLNILEALGTGLIMGTRILNSCTRVIRVIAGTRKVGPAGRNGCCKTQVCLRDTIVTRRICVFVVPPSRENAAVACTFSRL